MWLEYHVYICVCIYKCWNLTVHCVPFEWNTMHVKVQSINNSIWWYQNYFSMLFITGIGVSNCWIIHV